MNREDYLFNDKRCEQAISDFKHSASNQRWLKQYNELYNTVTIQPEGLPRITSFNLGDEKFEKIKIFSSLYAAAFNAFYENDKKKIEDSTIVFKIDKVAILEDRRFINATQETYLFIEKGYLKSYSEINNYVPKFQANSVDATQKNNFIHALELKTLIPILAYNAILIEVLELSTEFEEVNIVFPYLVDNNDFDENDINKVIHYSLNSSLVKRSFTAQRMMLELVFKNKRKMESKLLLSILSEFPHVHGLFKNTNSKNIK